MTAQSGTHVVHTETWPPRWRHRAEGGVTTLVTRVAVPAGFLVIMVVAIIVTIAGTALAQPSQRRPAAAPAADIGSAPHPRLPPAAAFARSEALARRALGSICSGCASGPSRTAGPIQTAPARPATGPATASVTPSAKSRGPTRYRVEAAHERHVIPR